MKQLNASFGSPSQAEQNKITVFSFFGPPGSGKGTLAQALVQNEQYRVLSTGDLCRWHVAQGTSFGTLLDGYLKQGHLIPDALITEMVIDWLEQQVATEGGLIILDGFPRTEGQAKLLLNYFRSDKASSVTFRVILFKAPNEIIIERLTNRVVCSNKKCQATLSLKDKMTSCKKCNSPLIQRNDDKKEVVLERLSHYPGYRDALLLFYKSVGQVVEVFDVDALAAETVYERFIDLTENSIL